MSVNDLSFPRIKRALVKQDDVIDGQRILRLQIGGTAGCNPAQSTQIPSAFSPGFFPFASESKRTNVPQPDFEKELEPAGRMIGM